MVVVKRKLAVILSADVAEYSRHVRESEEIAVATLRSHRTIVDQLIAQHEGRIANTAGDSVLAEFASPVEAVRCALEMQEALRGRNAELPEARRMWFRVGINLGDVMVQEGGDLLGDGVNVAARLQTLAEPGGICISANVREQVENKVALALDDLGQQQVKNIPQPVRVFRLRAGVGGGRPHAAVPRPWRAGIVAAVAAAVIVAAVGGWFALRSVRGKTAHDGTWAGDYTCEPVGRQPAFSQHRIAVVRDGDFAMSRGKLDEENSFEIKGTVSRDGRVAASGRGIGPNGPYTIEFIGKVAGETMTLNGSHNGVRPCAVSLQRTSR